MAVRPGPGRKAEAVPGSTPTADTRIDQVVPIPAPAELLADAPLSRTGSDRVAACRERIADILHRRDPRLLVVVGPCSIHDPVAAREYAERLSGLRDALGERLEIVMRVYFEKPRTTVGWKGLINDPDMDGSFAIERGLRAARGLLVELAELGVPAACEFLDAATGQYYADTVSWGAIGARTTESQVHRELASGLSCPVGFKNGTGGDVGIAIDAIVAAGHPHAFLSPTEAGRTALYRTRGNPDAHLILRGGHRPNFDATSVAEAGRRLREAGVDRRLMIDCSHANSAKDFRRQSAVALAVAGRLADEADAVGGLMIESHLVEGRQAIGDARSRRYGQSVTDACIGWDETVATLQAVADAVPG